ncbi:hypothetical protein DPMN_112114 [Dreissena polymorpha]|uniref:Uncharacterized protein n=1 Tax=Dreissena polymorpha TaxID=45954 RepID=A0A9D4KFH5_DREPO|nr:hypothetical protein DPMN_112114 [Dreissena polymorpha]
MSSEATPDNTINVEKTNVREDECPNCWDCQNYYKSPDVTQEPNVTQKKLDELQAAATNFDFKQPANVFIVNSQNMNEDLEKGAARARDEESSDNTETSDNEESSDNTETSDNEESSDEEDVEGGQSQPLLERKKNA